MTGPLDYGYKLLGDFNIPGKVVTKSNEKLLAAAPRFNRRARPGRRLFINSPKVIAYENVVAFLAKTTFKHTAGLTRGWIIIQPFFKNHTHPDLSNLPKSIFDAMVNSGVLANDREIASTVLPAVYGPEERTRIELWEAP